MYIKHGITNYMNLEKKTNILCELNLFIGKVVSINVVLAKRIIKWVNENIYMVKIK